MTQRVGRQRHGDLTVAVTDLWERADPSTELISSMLTGGAGPNTTDIDAADIVVHTVFGNEHLRARDTTVAFSVEPQFATRRSDFTIDCRHLVTPSHLRLPPWAYIWMLLRTPTEVPSEPDDPARRRFCNFIYSNPRCPTRNAFFEMLHARQPVDALGAVHHNRDDDRLSARSAGHWHRSKIDVLRDYKFTVAFENTELIGYTTEKLVDAWLADSVPIYWGDPAHTLDFPAGSCLSLYDAGSMSRLVDQVLDAHRDPARYAELRANNPFRTGHAQQALQRYQDDLVEFVAIIRDHALARRDRPRHAIREETRVAFRRLIPRAARALRRLGRL